jgi:1-deoxy-D-xylulose 5-phosphate reductoisomerase
MSAVAAAVTDVDVDSDHELEAVFSEVKASYETIVESLTAAIKGLKELKKVAKSSSAETVVSTKKGSKKLKEVVRGAKAGKGVLVALEELN